MSANRCSLNLDLNLSVQFQFVSMQIISFINSKYLTFIILHDNMSINKSKSSVFKTMQFISIDAIHFGSKYSNEKYFERKFWLIVKFGLKITILFKIW